MSTETYFADVILPLALPQLFTYRVPHEWNNDVKEGKRVLVPFGKNKLYTGIIKRLHFTAPAAYEAKYIENILDEFSLINNKQFQLWDWMSEYYMSTLGELMQAALPAGFKLSSTSKFILNYQISIDHQAINDKEYLLIEAIEKRMSITIDEAAEILQIKHPHKYIKSLLDRAYILIEEEVKEKVKPRTISLVELTDFSNNEKNLEAFVNELSLKKKTENQQKLILTFLKLSQHFQEKRQPIKKDELLLHADVNESTLKSLIKKNILQIVKHEVSRFGETTANEEAIKELNESQFSAYNKINSLFTSKNAVLLQGVTSSGKTEVYIKLIQDTLFMGKQVLYLLPEIALTTQIIHRLQKVFGNQVGVYHSKFNESERVEVWKNLMRSEAEISGMPRFNIVLGVRSSIFLPFNNLGLIIVDEEHDSSYKQVDPSPRYQARDCAMYLGHLHGAKILLGSATPSVESYYNAKTGKYGLVEMRERFGGMLMPIIEIADTKKAKANKSMKTHFSTQLLESIDEALKNKEQVILFQNRRGFAPMLMCDTCHWTPMCKNCDVSLTFHKSLNLLRCHYCGYSTKPIEICQACGSDEMKMIGFGTEKIEEELAVFFPQARISRMDLDTTRSRYSYKQIINDFEDQKVDILVGTQMVTKGLDFNHVSLVGIINADSMMSFPDFRAHERAFQLMAQVAGRAGRKNKQGKVIIQTSQAAHFLIKQLIENNYVEVFEQQINERQMFKYPPFYRLINITVKHRDKYVLDDATANFANILKQKLGARVLGPEYPSVARINNYYLKNILIKLEKELSPSVIKKDILKDIITLRKTELFKQVRIALDVDPG
ncbi:MAG TPA: primosomal protein N' [Bacteroidia bacterium]|nr:primosomal protein N' [Bacteroidia bacterium]